MIKREPPANLHQPKEQPHGHPPQRQAQQAKHNLSRRLDVAARADHLGVGKKRLPQHESAAIVEQRLPFDQGVELFRCAC